MVTFFRYVLPCALALSAPGMMAWTGESSVSDLKTLDSTQLNTIVHSLEVPPIPAATLRPLAVTVLTVDVGVTDAWRGVEAEAELPYWQPALLAIGAAALTRPLDTLDKVSTSWLDLRMKKEASPSVLSGEAAMWGANWIGRQLTEVQEEKARVAWADRAWRYWHRANPDAAFADFDRWLAEFWPADAAATRTFALSRFAGEAGDDAAAETYLNRLLDDDHAKPIRDQVLLAKGMSLLRQEKPGAEAFLQQMIEEHTQSALVPRARLLLAWLTVMDGREAEAKGYLDALLKDTPNDPLAPRARNLLESINAPALDRSVAKRPGQDGTPTPAPVDEGENDVF